MTAQDYDEQDKAEALWLVQLQVMLAFLGVPLAVVTRIHRNSRGEYVGFDSYRIYDAPDEILPRRRRDL